MDYTDMNNEVSYSSLPTRSIRQFLWFLKNEIQPALKYVKIPILIVHSENDRVIHPRSALFIYDRIKSSLKRLYWVKSNHHIPIRDECKSELFERIFDFLQETIKNQK
jgi:esterase/lipase